MTDNDTISRKLTLHRNTMQIRTWEDICTQLEVYPNAEGDYPDYINTNSSPVSWAWIVEVQYEVPRTGY